MRRVDRLSSRGAGRRGSGSAIVDGVAHAAERRRTGVADRRPRARIAVPRGEDELVQRVVRRAQQRPAARRASARGMRRRRRGSPRAQGVVDARPARCASARRQAARTVARAPSAPPAAGRRSRARRRRRFRALRQPRSAGSVGNAPSSITGTIAATIGARIGVERRRSSGDDRAVVAGGTQPAGGGERGAAGESGDEEGAAGGHAGNGRALRKPDVALPATPETTVGAPI